MSQPNEARSSVKPDPVVLARMFSAPRALMFKAWSSADHMRRWFCPEQFSVPHATVEFRAGGRCEICMRAPDGQEFWSKGQYIEVTPPERLVFSTSVVDADGQPRFTAMTTVTFEDHGAATRMTVHQAYEIFDPAAMAAISGAPEGWRTTLDRLGQEVARIAATPAQVFHALTDPVAKARWFGGGAGYTMLERSIDVRPGGRERAVGRWTSGTVSAFDAIYLDTVTDRRLVYAYEMHLDGRKISASLATVELFPSGAGTRLKVTEQGAFLDGYDDAGSRQHGNGTGALLDRLDESLHG